MSKNQTVTAQELFKNTDIERTIDAYLLTEQIIYDYENLTMDKKFIKLDFIRESIRENIKAMRNCVPTKKEPKTIFIVEYETEDWEDRGKKDFDCFYMEDEWAKQNIGKEPDILTDRYGIDMLSLKELASYKIASSSIKEYGTETCCAIILHELFMFGYTEKQRKENIEDLYKKLDEADKELKESGGKTFISEEEFFSELLNTCDDEDEKQHMILERQYDESVRDIERRYEEKVIKRNHKKMFDMLKEEYC